MGLAEAVSNSFGGSSKCCVPHTVIYQNTASPHLDVMKSMRPLIFSSWSAETSTSLSSEGDRWDRAVPPVPRLMLEDVELELRPESVIGDGWQCGNTSCTPIEQFTTIYTFTVISHSSIKWWWYVSSFLWLTCKVHLWSDWLNSQDPRLIKVSVA